MSPSDGDDFGKPGAGSRSAAKRGRARLPHYRHLFLKAFLRAGLHRTGDPARSSGRHHDCGRIGER